MLPESGAKLGIHTSDRNMAALGEGPVTSKVLIIDISDFENRKHDIGQQLYHASKDVGFFYIKGHGVPQHEVDSIFKDGELFYGLPDDVKEKHVWIPDRYLGWRSQSDLESVTGVHHYGGSCSSARADKQV